MKIYRRGKLVDYNPRKLNLDGGEIDALQLEIREQPKINPLHIGSVVELNGVIHKVVEINKNKTIFTLKEDK